MIPVTTCAGRKVAVFGLGRSGRATCAALVAGGATVAAWDDSDKARAAFSGDGGVLTDLNAAEWSDFAALVLAPGVPLTHPEPHWTVKRAAAANVPVIGDVELFALERQARCPSAPFIAITGTNGKSTTTALLAHVLRTAGGDVAMGGNIGVPILELGPPAGNRVHVIELSSYQIDLMPTLKPTIGMLLNLSPDHIDRHGTFQRYAAIKERVLADAGFALIGLDDHDTAAIAARYVAKAPTHCFPVATALEPEFGVFCAGTTIFIRPETGSKPEPLADVAGIPTLRGRHNLQNAAFAAAAAHRLGLDHDAIQHGLETFPGLRHRMENVGRLGRVLFVNDSKATNADSADKALSSFAGDIYWIAGGRQKEGGIEPLRQWFGRTAKAYLIGECADGFAATLAGAVPYEICGTLERATAAAARDAVESKAAAPVVLLSPACASFDQFRSFEVRGDAFCAALARLDGIALHERAPV
jgi:UDP-N-acetylmuramoylalanine--D-glutamate ligase